MMFALTSACSPQSAAVSVESNETELPNASPQCGALYAPTGYGSCRLVNLASAECGVAVTEIQDNIGQRISGWKKFRDGLIIQFQDGAKMSLWSRRIDCLDPPYAPLTNAEQTVQPNSGAITPSGSSPEPAETPLQIPPGQANEPWLVELLERQEANQCGPNVVRGRVQSLNGQYEYLEVCSWVTSPDILQRRLSDGRLKEVVDGYSPKVIHNGPWMGFLLVTRHKYKAEGGSYEQTDVVRPDGTAILQVPGTEVEDGGAALATWLRNKGWVAN
jgi:hypothetical protein